MVNIVAESNYTIGIFASWIVFHLTWLQRTHASFHWDHKVVWRDIKCCQYSSAARAIQPMLHFPAICICPLCLKIACNTIANRLISKTLYGGHFSLFRDQGKKNDFIGTAYLHLSAISGQGELGEGKQSSWFPVSGWCASTPKIIAIHNFSQELLYAPLCTFWLYFLLCIWVRILLRISSKRKGSWRFHGYGKLS